MGIFFVFGGKLHFILTSAICCKKNKRVTPFFFHKKRDLRFFFARPLLFYLRPTATKQMSELCFSKENVIYPKKQKNFPMLILSPALKRWGAANGRASVANLPTCGPFLFLSPAPKRWRSPSWHGLCS